jgi:hypothetical protein
MGAAEVTPVELLIEIIKEHSPENIWLDSPLIGYRQLGNTNRGEIGEEFLRRYLRKNGLPVDVPHNHRGRTSLTDMRIGEHAFEVKTASLGANQTFQFNHVRLDRKYSYLLCLGICPHEIVFNVWSKGQVAEETAGTLVRMAEGQSVTYKLTKN